MLFPNPKRGSKARAGELYAYYAGFSPDFVSATLPMLGLSTESVILDPWNGAGTTTRIAASSGHHAIGFDINPVMVLVAKAGLLSNSVSPSMRVLAAEVSDLASNLDDEIDDGDPLLDWFTPAGATALRNLDRAIQHALITAENRGQITTLRSLRHVSSLAAFFYTALFRLVRSSTERFRSSNPTWVKADPKSRVRTNAESFRRAFVEEVAAMEEALPSGTSGVHSTVQVDLCDSTKLDVRDRSIDAVISSPPYCTRIDYAIATLPELAVIGADATTVRSIRERMIGTPTVDSAMPVIREQWGPTCVRFLRDVELHPSKASSGYYSKVFRSYFERLSNSMTEIRRACKSTGKVALVVQDSYYKDVHNDLPQIVEELAIAGGFKLLHRADFEMKATIRAINTRSRSYHDASRSTESVLVFEPAE